MASANRQIQHDLDATAAHNRRRRIGGHGKARIYLEIDVSSFNHMVSGLSASYIYNNPSTKAIMLDWGKRVQSFVRRHIHSIMSIDPRAAWRSVMAAFTTKRKGYPEVFITTMRQASGWSRFDQEAPDLRKHKGHFGRRTRSKRTQQIESYYGLDRGIVVNVWNRNKAKGFFTNTTRSKLQEVAPKVAQEIMDKVIAPKMNK